MRIKKEEGGIKMKTDGERKAYKWGDILIYGEIVGNRLVGKTEDGVEVKLKLKKVYD